MQKISYRYSRVSIIAERMKKGEKMLQKKYLLEEIANNLFIIVIIFILSYFSGMYFDRIRISFTKENDIKIYRDICEKEVPLFKMGFDNGSLRFSLIEELNGILWDVFDFSYSNPLQIICSRFYLFDFYVQNLELNKRNELDKINADQLFKNKLTTNQSSLEYIAENEINENWTETTNGLIFTKECNLSFDLKKLIKEKFKINFEKKGPKVLIYHTHNFEGYLPVNGNNQSQSKAFKMENSVIRVGDELAKNLKNNFNIDVIHNATAHDIPDSRYCYSNALNTVNNILKSYPSIKVILDIHRDGISNTEKFRPVVKLQEKNVAKIMMVVGTNYTGLNHPGWQKNLTFAIHIQKRLEELCPGITRPIHISKNRYNQHVSDNAIIIEVGGDGNTISESLASVKYLAKAISIVLE
jgi:stage II sporulation protein P